MKLRILAAVVVSVLWAGTARATPTTYTFQGTITSSSYPGISVGDSFSGTFVYEPAAQYLDTSSNVSTFYDASGSISVVINGIPYQTVSGLYYYASNNVPTGDELQLKRATSPTSMYPFLLASFYDSTFTTFSTDASTALLPTSLSGFDSFAFGIYDLGGPIAIAQGPMTFAPQTNGVPDPASTLLMLGATVTGMAAIRRRWH